MRKAYLFECAALGVATNSLIFLFYVNLSIFPYFRMAFGSVNFLVLIDTTQNKLISTLYPPDLTGTCVIFH